MLLSFSLTDVLMADYPSRDCPKDPIEADFEVTLIQNQLCELHGTGCNGGQCIEILLKYSFTSSAFLNLILNLLDALWHIKGILYTLPNC